MLLSFLDLEELVADGVIKNVPHSAINASSIDLSVGSTFLIEDGSGHPGQKGAWGESAKNPGCPFPIVSIRDRIPPHMRKVVLEEGQPLVLLPGQFCLAESQQVFNLPPHISSEYKLKSSLARSGLNHLLAGWCDSGWNGSVLTLEYHNVLSHHAIEIRAGDPAGQMIFFKHRPVPQGASYAAKGRYNGDTSVKAMKK